MRSVVKWALLSTAVLVVSSCTFFNSFVPRDGETTDVIDRQKNLSVDDFRDLSEINKESDVKPTAALGAPPLPNLAEVLSAPRPPKVANTKLVTLSVTEDVPLRDVLFELGRLAKVDIEVGSGLNEQGINLRATDRPFNEVIERIATLAHLRYSVSGNSIRVERDLPYLKNYSLDFLNIVRSSTGGYNLSTQILSGGGGGGSSGGGSSGGGGGSGVGTSGSTASITSQSESDLWSSLDESITEILNYSPDAATDSAGATPGAAPPQQGSSGKSGSNFVINRQVGLLSVTATDRQHEMIQRFLTLMTRNSSAQVLIEAKIVEVSLADQFLSGVNWNQVLGTVDKTFGRIGTYAGSIADGPTLGSQSGVGAGSFALGLQTGDLDFVIQAAQRYGTTRTLSSPRLSAINNQQAVLTFAKNEVFFDCKYEPAQATTSTTGPSTSTDATLDCPPKTVPIGIILNILPSVNLDTQEVTLSVRPTLTRKLTDAISPVVGFLKSQAASTAAADQIPFITVPVIEVRELDSIAKIRSGGVMIIGGLMEDKSRNTSDGVPGVSEVPLLGNLFKSRAEDSEKRELIIFIKATIVNSDGNSQPVDRKVYEKFVTDPRPLFPKE